MRPFYYYYYYILQYSPLIPLLVGVRHFRKLDSPAKIFFWYLVVSLSLTIVMTVIALQKKNNLWIMNLSQLMYIVMLTRMFTLWQENDVLRKAMWGSMVVFIMVWCAEIILYQRLFEFTKVAKPFVDLIFIAAACTTLYQLNRENQRLVMEMPQFWISCGILIYFGGMLLVNMFSSSLFRVSDAALRVLLVTIQPALNFISHLCFIGGFQYQCQQQSYSGLSSSEQRSSLVSQDS